MIVHTKLILWGSGIIIIAAVLALYVVLNSGKQVIDVAEVTNITLQTKKQSEINTKAILDNKQEILTNRKETQQRIDDLSDAIKSTRNLHDELKKAHQAEQECAQQLRDCRSSLKLPNKGK